MKKTRKIIAIVLSLTLLMFGTALSAGAGSIFGIELGGEKDESFKWLSYSNGKGSQANCIYLPPASLVADDGYVVVTDEDPLAFDYKFVHWEDESGNIYYPGQEYYVTGMDTLYAVWEEKDDSDSKIIRIIKTAIEAFIRMFSHFRYYVTIVEDFSRNYNATTEAAVEGTVAA